MSKRNENDNHNAKINIKESTTIRRPRLKELGMAIISVKRKVINFKFPTTIFD